MDSNALTNLFFSELRAYNSTNFKSIATADLSVQDAKVHKSFSAVVTRYFIFREKHPEISPADHNMLYFKLKLDLVARYFSEFPDTTTDNLIALQLEINHYLKEKAHERAKEVEDDTTTEIRDQQLESSDKVLVEQ